MSNETKFAVDTSEPDSIWNAAFVSIFLVSVAFNMGQNMSNQLMPVYADHLGASPVAVGVVVSAFGLSAMAFRFFSSPIMDTYNRKHVIIGASVVMAAAFLGYSMSRGISNLTAFRLLQGCGMAFGNSCSLAIVSDTIPKDRYSTGIGYFSIAQVVSQAIGPSVGLWLVDKVGFAATFVINSGLMLLAALLATRLKLAYRRTKKLVLSLSNVIAREAVVPSVLLHFVAGGLAFGNSFLILHATGRGVSSIGLYFTVNALTVLASRSLVGRLMDKHGVVKVVLPALCFNVIACIMISFSHMLLHFLAAAVVNALGTGASQPAFQALAMKAVASDRRGTASNTSFLGMDTASLLWPVLGGLCVKAFGYSTMFRLQTVPYIICMGVLFAFRTVIGDTEERFRQGKEADPPVRNQVFVSLARRQKAI